MVEHSTIADPDIHEPKGVAASGAGRVYLSDGAGSGNWQYPLTGINSATADQVFVSDGAGGGSFKTITLRGWENIDNSGAAQSLTSGVRTQVLNDAAGPATFDFEALPTATGSVWDPSTNSFDWQAAGLKVGDTVDIRFDINYTVNTGNDGFLVEFDLGIGSATPVTLPVKDFNIDTAGTEEKVPFNSFFIGSNDILTSPARLYVTANSAGDSIDVNGWYVRFSPIHPVLS